MRKNYPLRIDEEVMDGVRRWANDDLRSLNGQIEFLLRESLRRAGRLSNPGLQNRDRKGVGGDSEPTA